MSITVDATYEDGVLKPDQPLPLVERQRVKVTVHEGPSRTSQSYGIIGWQGDVEGLRKIAEDPEFDVAESR